jgi:hypothetical protein
MSKAGIIAPLGPGCSPFQRQTDRELAFIPGVVPHHLQSHEDQNDGQAVAQQVEALHRVAEQEVERPGGVFSATLLFTATLVGGLLLVGVPATYCSGFRVEFGHFWLGAALPLGPRTG